MTDQAEYFAILATADDFEHALGFAAEQVAAHQPCPCSDPAKTLWTISALPSGLIFQIFAKMRR